MDERLHPSHEQETGQDSAGERGADRWVLWLLLLPVIAYIYPPWYARSTPDLAGIPFFIWYQFAWVVGGVAVTAFVYWFRDLRAPARKRQSVGGR